MFKSIALLPSSVFASGSWKCRRTWGYGSRDIVLVKKGRSFIGVADVDALVGFLLLLLCSHFSGGGVAVLFTAAARASPKAAQAVAAAGRAREADAAASSKKSKQHNKSIGKNKKNDMSNKRDND